ncbi:MAG TPA: hypothetical protein VKI65_06185 [Gemmataceae bacterium]|nr:hypothetical protein [Gemmataceae bacterium]
MNLAPPLLAAEHLSFYWHLPILIVVVCLVYGATRHDRWDRIMHEACRWMLRMALFLVGIMLVLSGLALDGSPVVVRVAVATVGLALEASLLFIK